MSPARAGRGQRHRRRLLVGAGAVAAEPVTARAVLLDGPDIAWVGADPADAPPHDEALDLGGAWLSPAFCDAHVHATAAGLALDGLDLADAEGAADLLARVRAAAPDADPVLGGGWDETTWQDPTLPDADDLASAAGGRRVRLARVDGHSCLGDRRTTDEVAADGTEGVERDASGRPTGRLTEEASEAAWARLRGRLAPARLARARAAFVADAAAKGVGAIHEMGHPALSSLDDARAWDADGGGLDVTVWWADPDPSVALAAGLRPGGDLFVDGSIGSRTAATSEPYDDGGHGRLLLDEDAVTALLVGASRAGTSAGLHAIGDRAVGVVVAALERAAAEVGADGLRACRHRVEHLEIVTAQQIAALARHGVTASVQPAFDARWGGPDGLYAERFGVARALASNPLDALDAAGLALAFGSDAPVTPVDPLAGIVAATTHRGGHGLSAERALAAQTLGGRRAAGQERAGWLRAGWRADLAVLDGPPIASTDGHRPVCLATIVAGRDLAGELDDEGGPPADPVRS